MKMKKRLLVVVFLLAISSAMAAMSYNKATVTNAAQLKVVNTNQALLTLEANTPWSWQSTVGAKDQTAVMQNGELFFQFGKGIDGGTGNPVFYGLQPNSEYQWTPLFTLRNKSAETINVTVSATGPFAPYITFGTASQAEAQANSATWGTQGASLTVNNIPKETSSGMQNIRNIAVKINIPSGAAISPDALLGSIVVQSSATN
ncbi:hypothetical protein [Paenibacillus silvisoli]|uniref:hypothetical protein n=1 Tax=Paenibacillus silvisoli TaxID=3110539 RepID=UPI002804121A|nr:hypothetical protein [Paenibacillus silvisoli]